MHGLGVEEVSSKCTLNGRELAVEKTRVLKSEEDNPGLGLLCSVGRVGGLDVGLGILDCRRTIFRRYRFPSEHPACTNDAVTVKSLFDLLVTQALSHSFIFEVGRTQPLSSWLSQRVVGQLAIVETWSLQNRASF